VTFRTGKHVASREKALQTRSLGHVPALNGLRAFAIGLVLLSHTVLTLVPGGFLGVNVFFVLSGFLITTLLLEERAANGKIVLHLFWMRRVLRLYPALFTLVAVFLIAGALHGSSHFGPWLREGWWAVSYQMDFREHHQAAIYGISQTWSLAVEEQFYLIWPPLLVVMTRYFGRRLVIAVTSLGIAASLADKIILVLVHTGSRRLYYLPDVNADLLLMGCLTAELFVWGYLDRFLKHRLLPSAGVVGIGIISVAALTFRNTNSTTWIFAGPTTLIALVAAVVIISLLVPKAPLSRFLSLKLFVWVGVISYSLYLWHESAFSCVHYFIQEPFGLYTVLAISFAFVPATLSYYLVEKRGLRLKSRFEVRR
jgi:peptidoglycan/LPS O-acetylase OafA/YrhL